MKEDEVKFLRSAYEDELNIAATLVQRKTGQTDEFVDFERIQQDYHMAFKHREAFRNSGPVFNYPQTRKEKKNTPTFGPGMEKG